MSRKRIQTFAAFVWFCGAESDLVAMTYRQTIKFAASGCNLGGCSNDAAIAYTDIVYPTGRKTAHLELTCVGSKRLYSLGTCAC